MEGSKMCASAHARDGRIETHDLHAFVQTSLEKAKQ